MKNLKSSIPTILFLAIFFIANGNLFGQETASITFTETTTSISSDEDSEPTVRIRISGDFHSDEPSSGHASIMVANSYHYTSRFEKDLSAEIEEIIVEAWGAASSDSARVKKWNHINGKVFPDLELKLKAGKVNITYKSDDASVLKHLEKLIKKICKATYQSNCE